MQQQQTQVDENGLPEFEPLRMYDMPATLLTQLMDGEASLGRAIRTLAKSESLSPRERDTYVQRLKKSYGGNVASDTLIDVFANPFTWLLFATLPIGVKQFQATRGRLIHGLAEAQKRNQRIFGYVAELARTMQAANLLNMGQTAAPTMLAQQILSRWDTLSRLEGQVLAPSGRTMAQTREALMQRLSKIHGESVVDLDHTRYRNAALSKALHEMDVMSGLWATGALEGGVARHTQAGTVRAGMFKPTVGGVTSDVAVPLMVSESEYRAMQAVHGRTIRTGDAVQIGGANFIVGDTGIIQGANNPAFKKLVAMFPPDEQAAINYRVLNPAPEAVFNVQNVDQAFFERWARSAGIHDELVDYLQAGRSLREEMKKRLFYTLDAAGNPTDVLDVDKIFSMWSKWQRQRGKTVRDLSPHEWAMDNLLPMEEIDRILPTWAKEAARRGSKVGVTSEKVRTLVAEKITPLLSQTYLPRNNFTVYKMETGINGGIRPLGPTHSDALARRRESIVDTRGVASIVIPRRGEGIPWDPQDLTVLRDLMQRQGVNPDLAVVTFPHLKDTLPVSAAIEKMKSMIKAGTLRSENRGHISTHGMGYEMNMRSYMRDSMSTVILHGSRIPDSAYTLLQEALRNRPAQLVGAYKGPAVPGTKMTARDKRELQVDELVEGGELTFSLPEVLSAHPEAKGYRRRLIKSLQLRDALKAKIAAKPTKKLISRLEDAEARIRGLRSGMRRLGRLEAPPAESLLTGARPYMTLDDAIETVLRVESPEVREYFERAIMPGLFGGSNPVSAFKLRNVQRARDVAGRIANSSAGQWINRNGGFLGKAIIGNLDKYNKMTGYNMDALYAEGGITGYLYATHLGFNAVSAMWNLMQPLQWATTWMGGEHILRGYASAFKQLGGYYAERMAKHGIGRITEEERIKLWQKHIRLAGKASGGRDLLGMGHDAISTLEGASFLRRPQGMPSLGKWLFIDTPLALFQAAEAVNRITVAEATMGWLGQLQKGSGIKLAANEVLDFAQLFQSMSNFNYNPITQLQAFQKGGLLGNSLLRMFLQYPSRTVSNLLVGSQLGGGTRSFGLGRIGGPTVEIPAFLGDMSRILGTGAVAYEIGKNVLNIDLSSGLAGAAIGQLPSQFVSQGIPVPPVLDIPFQLIDSLASQDREQFRQAIFRLAPGGVALQKAFNALPPVPGGGNFGVIQGQYADWSNRNEQGMVPVYNSDGMLQGFDSPFALVMRGIGADFKKHQSPQEATKFLLANRQEMVDLRRKYKDAVLGNNMSAAQAIEAEYRKRYGVPMTVKPGEWDRAVQMREVSVSERMLETMPADVRDMYQQSLQGPAFASAMGLPVGGLAQGETAKQRASIRAFNADVVNPAEGQ
jgi:hypothetical protein